MSNPEPAPKTRHALAFIAVTLLLDTIGFGLIMPVYPRLLVELTGQTLSQAAVYGGWLGFIFWLSTRERATEPGAATESRLTVA